jgi:hypothetical protein
MTNTPELKRYACSETGGGEIIEWPNGEYVRFADVEAYTQAAIAAVMMGAVKYCDRLSERAYESGDEVKGRYLSCVSAGIGDMISTDATAALEERDKQVWNAALALPEITALIDALAYMVNHAEWRERNDGVFWEATKLARAALAAIRAIKGGDA